MGRWLGSLDLAKIATLANIRNCGGNVRIWRDARILRVSELAAVRFFAHYLRLTRIDDKRVSTKLKQKVRQIPTVLC